jgi:hypothetical protein
VVDGNQSAIAQTQPIGAVSLHTKYSPYRVVGKRIEILKQTKKRLGRIVMVMGKAWTVSRSEVYSPKRLREFVLEAEEKGAVFLPAVHSILGLAIERDPTTLAC